MIRRIFLPKLCYSESVRGKGLTQVVLLGALVSTIALIVIGFLFVQKSQFGTFVFKPKVSPTPISSLTDETTNRKTEISTKNSSMTQLTGRFHIIWGDPPPDSGLPPKQLFILTDDQGKDTEIKITPQTVFVNGKGVLDYNFKKVKITGIFDSESNIFEATKFELT